MPTQDDNTTRTQLPVPVRRAAQKRRVLMLANTLPDPQGTPAARRVSALIDTLADICDLHLTILATGKLHLRAWQHAQQRCTALTVEPIDAMHRRDLTLSRTVHRWQQEGHFPIVLSCSAKLWPAIRWFRQSLVVSDLEPEAQACLDPETGEPQPNAGARRIYKDICRAAERSGMAIVGTRAQTTPLLTRAGRSIILPSEHLAQLPGILEAFEPAEHRRASARPLARAA